MAGETESKLDVIANLLAISVVEGLSLEEAVWRLRRAGMGNKEISPILGISPESVGAHYSNRKKKEKKG